MKRSVSKSALAGLILGLAVPVVARAADDDLTRRIEALSREIEQLRSQVIANDQKVKAVEEARGKADSASVAELKSEVQRLESKSLGKWLTIGGDLPFPPRLAARRDRAVHRCERDIPERAVRSCRATSSPIPSTAPGSSSFFGAAAAGSMSTAGALRPWRSFRRPWAGCRPSTRRAPSCPTPATRAWSRASADSPSRYPQYKPKNSHADDEHGGHRLEREGHAERFLHRAPADEQDVRIAGRRRPSPTAMQRRSSPTASASSTERSATCPPAALRPSIAPTAPGATSPTATCGSPSAGVRPPAGRPATCGQTKPRPAPAACRRC